MPAVRSRGGARDRLEADLRLCRPVQLELVVPEQFDVKKGKYYGHPNPERCEWVLNGGNPTTGVDLLEDERVVLGVVSHTAAADYCLHLDYHHIRHRCAHSTHIFHLYSTGLDFSEDGSRFSE